MKSKIIEKNNLFFIGLIIFIWLVIYITWTIIFDQKLGWDEVSYMSTAKGIAANFDFSSRFTTVFGLIKYPFPQNTHHYPVYATYLAIFFKLFGPRIEVAYFSTWLAALAVCVFIYLLMLLITENDKLYSFFTGVIFLFLPTILHYCDTAMMEIPGCALLVIFTYFIFKDLSKGKLNLFLISFASILMYFFKSLFIGSVVTFLILVLMLANKKLTGFEARTKFPVYINLIIIIGIFLGSVLILTRFVFLPLAPMMNLDKSAVINKVYADFLGGFFNDPIGNAIIHLKGFVEKIVILYYPKFPVYFPPESFDGFLIASRTWTDLGLFWVVLCFSIIYLIFLWKKLSSINRMFILYVLISIITFNVIFNLIVTSDINQRCRHNMIYTPLLLISSAILLRVFIYEHLKGFIIFVAVFLALVYIPFYNTQLFMEAKAKDIYHDLAKTNSEIIKKYVGNDKPMFLYFTGGTHVTWDLFPTRIISQEASNEQIKQINSKLPQPIEYLFLTPEDNLVAENRDLILNAKPIVDSSYTFYGIDSENKVAVYRYKKQSITGK